MKKITFLLGSILSSVMLFSQVYLNETFALPIDSITPPTGWTNVDSAGGGEVWRFDNPGSQTLNAPITSPAAIFDSDYNGSGGIVAEDAYLESPAFNAFGATSVKLTFDQFFNSFIGLDTASIEVFDGTSWVEINSTTSSTNNPQRDTFDITTLVSGTTTAKVRFRWRGDWGFWWIIDNIKVFTPPSNDLQVAAVINPISSTTLGATENITVQVNNLGSTAASNFPLTYILDNGTPVTETVAGPIAISGNLQYTFTATGNFSTPGAHTLRVYSALSGDADLTNDTLDKVITKFTGITSFPYFENFESNDGQWVAGGTNSSWQWGVPNATEIDTAASGTKAWVTNLTGSYNLSEASYVESQVFDFTTLVAPVFSAKVFWTSENSWDGTVLQSSIDGGLTWQKVGKIGDPNNWYNDSTINGLVSGLEPSGQGWTGDQTLNGSLGWVSTKHDLTGLGGQSTVKLRFAFGSDPSIAREGFAFDDVSVYEKPSNDAEMYSILSPTSGCNLGNETVTVEIVNAGITNISNFEVAYSLNNGTPVIDTVASTILPQDTLVFTFTQTVNLSTVGNYSLKAYTSLSTDAINTNDTTNKSIVNIPVISTFPYVESFETSNGGWTSGGLNNSWALGTPANTIINTASNGTQAWVTNLTGQYNLSEASYVKSPCFDLSSLSDPIISLDVYWNSEFSWDGAVLQSSIDGGITWQKVGAFGDPFNWYNDNSINGFTGNPPLEPSGEGWTGRTSSSNGSNGWLTARHKITNLAGQSAIFRIAFGSDPSIADEGFAFDNFKIFESPAIDVQAVKINRPQAGCGLSAAETIAATYENIGTDTLTGFSVGYSVNGVSILAETFTDTLYPNTSKRYTFTTLANLSSFISYTINAYSSAVGDADVTNDTTSVTFTNLAAEVIPYNESFDLLTDGLSDFSSIKWTNVKNGSFQWQAETGSTSSSNTGPSAPRNGIGTYIYAETSSGNVGDTIYLNSTCVDLTPTGGPNSSARVDYWYHMYGATIVGLGLEIDSAGYWVTIDTLLGQKQTATTDTFRMRSIDLSAYQGQGVSSFRFWAVKGTSFTGDVAIDDFRVYDTTAVDVAMDSILSPLSDCGLSATADVTVKLRNIGLSAVSNFPVSYTLNGGTPVVETVTSTINPGTSFNYTFTAKANVAAIQNHTLSVSVNVTGDGNAANNTLSSNVASSFSDVIDSTNTPVKSYDFEANDGNLITYADTLSSSWAWGVPNTFYISSAKSGTKIWTTNLTGNHNANEMSYLETSCYDLSTIAPTEQLFIAFQAIYKTETGEDQIWMEYTTNNGKTWSKVLPSASSVNFYSNTTANVWEGFSSGGVGVWIPVVNDLVGLGGNSKVKFRFAFKSNGTVENEGFGIDDLQINLAVNDGENLLNGDALLSVQPNPSNGQFNLVFNNYAKGIYLVEIMNVNGQLVNAENVAVASKFQTKPMNLDNLEKGVYFVKVTNGSNVTTQKLVIK